MPQRSLKTLEQSERATEGYFSGRVAFRFEKYAGTQKSGIGLLFAGQGSVYPGMFRDAYNEFKEVRDLFAEADALAKAWALPAISAYVKAPESLSESERYSIQNICLFTAEVGLFRALASRGIHARALSAHSFGEYAAIVAAGTASFESIFNFVCFREKHSPARNERGYMIAVNGGPDQIKGWLKGFEYHVANLNSAEQTVISVAPGNVEEILAALEKQGIRRKQLPTPQPYHSPLLSDMPAKLSSYIDSHPLTPTPTKIPLVSSVTQKVHQTVGATELRTLLTRQMVEPVDFVAQLQALAELGCTQFIEIGPAVVLGSFVESVLGSKSVPVEFYARLSRKKKAANPTLQKNKLWGTVNKIISQVTGYAIEDISLQDKFQEDLGIDSIKKTEIIFSVLDEVKGDPNQALDTSSVQQVQDLLTFVDGVQKAPQVTARAVEFERYLPTWKKAPLVATQKPTIPVRFFSIPATWTDAQARAELQKILSELRTHEASAYVLRLPRSMTDSVESLIQTFLEPGFKFIQQVARTHQGIFNCKLFLVHDGTDHPVATALSSFFKSLKKEFPESALRSLYFDTPPTEADLKHIITRELTDPIGTDVLYAKNQRHVRILEPVPTSTPKDTTPKTLLAIGGAKGITFSLLERFAKASGGTFYIWGRSSETDVAKNLATLGAAGASVHYQQVDATDTSACERALKVIYEKETRLDYIWNGAGIERSELFTGKTFGPEEIRSKTLPLIHLLKLKQPHTHVFHFSSIVSEFGNKGQTLYAWANKYGEALCTAEGATAIAWPPWDNVGMTAKQGIVNALKSQGVALLTPDRAFELFSAECNNPAGQTVFYCDEHDPAAYGAGLLDMNAHRFLGTVSGDSFARPISYATDSYLADHEIDGKAYVPGAVGLAGFLALIRTRGCTSIRNLKFGQPLALEKGSSAKAQWEYSVDGKLSLKTTRPHFTAEHDFQTNPVPTLNVGRATHEIDARTLYGKGALFHGRSFQGISNISLHGQEGAELSFTLTLPPIFDGGFYGRVAQWIDCIFQGTALFGLSEYSALYLPTSVDQVDFHPLAAGSVPKTARIQWISHSAEALAATAVIGDPANPLFVLTGIRMTKKETLARHRLKIREIK